MARYHTEVLGEHLRRGDELNTDDPAVWHEIVAIANEDGTDFDVEHHPDSFKLTFEDQSGMVVKPHDHYRVRRERDDD